MLTKYRESEEFEEEEYEAEGEAHLPMRRINSFLEEERKRVARVKSATIVSTKIQPFEEDKVLSSNFENYQNDLEIFQKPKKRVYKTASFNRFFKDKPSDNLEGDKINGYGFSHRKTPKLGGYISNHTIDEQDSKEDSQGLHELQHPKLTIALQKSPKNKKKSPKERAKESKKVSKRFQSKMLTLFD